MEKKKYMPGEPGLIVVDEGLGVIRPRELSNRELLLRICEKLGVSIE